MNKIFTLISLDFSHFGAPAKHIYTYLSADDQIDIPVNSTKALF
jgi:hypothetical protein